MRNLKLGSVSVKYGMHNYALPDGKVIYGSEATHMWFAVGTSDIDGHFTSSVRFHPVSVKRSHQNEQENALVLLNTNQNSENVVLRKKMSPWVLIAEQVHGDLFSCFHRLRKQMTVDNFEVRPSIIARLGKVLFRLSPSGLEDACKRSVTGTTLRNSRKAFYTDLPAELDNNVRGVAEKIGLLNEENEDVYTVEMSDEMRTDSTLTCKCRVRTEDNKLELCKVEVNHLRHTVADISCVDKNLDLRLMLCTKRVATCLTDEEENITIRGILNSATLDPAAKGGLRWPSSGEVFSSGRFRVVGVWHIKPTAYRNSSMRLKVRNVDRIDFRTSTWGASTEINLKLKGVLSKLQKEAEIGLVWDMLKENLTVIWDNFLCFDHSLT